MKIVQSNLFFQESINGLKKYRIWSRLAKMAIDNQYKQNTLGPFWISANTAVLIAAFSLVYSQILSVNLSDHIVYVGSGLICWYFYSSLILKGCNIFIISRQMMLQLPLPISIYIFKLIYQELLIFKYNLLVLAIIYILFGKPLSLDILLILPAFTLIVINIYFLVFSLAIIAARFRDVASTAQAIIAPLMFLTPIIWSADSLSSRPIFVTLNPIFHLIEIWRSPIIGSSLPTQSWLFVTALTITLIVVSNFLYKKYHHRVTFWL